MQCPIDGETLLMTSREGVEIDYCPRCRGIWLDRGELDKILERADPVSASGATTRVDTKSTRPKRERDDDDDDDDNDDRKRSKRTSRDSPYRKRKDHVSFIKDIFDF